MRETTASVRELKSRLSHYLRLVKSGESVEITERGVPIGRIVPLTVPVEDRIEALARAGLLAWNWQHLAPVLPVARARNSRSVTELLIEDRR